MSGRHLARRYQRKRYHVENGPQGQGAKAHADGLARDSNPYTGCSMSQRAKHRVWDKGWNRARMAAQQANSHGAGVSE